MVELTEKDELPTKIEGNGFILDLNYVIQCRIYRQDDKTTYSKTII